SRSLVSGVSSNMASHGSCAGDAHVIISRETLRLSMSHRTRFSAWSGRVGSLHVVNAPSGTALRHDDCVAHRLRTPGHRAAGSAAKGSRIPGARFRAGGREVAPVVGGGDAPAAWSGLSGDTADAKALLRPADAGA